jgi:hypothetical protein
LVDSWSLTDNSGRDLVEVARGEYGQVEIVDQERWEYYRSVSAHSA